MDKYYIPLDKTKDINYIYILMIYSLAEYNRASKRYDIVRYTTQTQLLERLNGLLKKYDKTISKSTLNRILNDRELESIYSVNSKEKVIQIHSNIKNKNCFVVLNQKEVDLIIKQDSKLFANYLIYLKYFCSISKNKTTDATAKQLLAACGYSNRSNGYIAKLSEYNRLLVNESILSISKYRDNNGNERNKYKFN